MKKKKIQSTYEQFVKDPKQKALLDREYRDLLMTEMLLAVKERKEIKINAYLHAINPKISKQ